MAALTFLLGGCSLFGVDGKQSDVTRAHNVWMDAAPANYRFDLAIGCFCLYWHGDATIVVEDDRVTAILDPATGEPLRDAHNGRLALEQFGDDIPTIDGLFGVITSAIRNGADDLEATYDPTYGYPTAVHIDYEHNTADDEIHYLVQNVRW